MVDKTPFAVGGAAVSLGLTLLVNADRLAKFFGIVNIPKDAKETLMAFASIPTPLAIGVFVIGICCLSYIFSGQISSALAALRRHRVFLGIALLICGCAMGVVGLSIIAAGPPSETNTVAEKTPKEIPPTKPPELPTPEQRIPEPPKAAFDLGGNTDIAVGKAQLCGEMTIIKTQPGSGGSFTLNDFTGIGLGAKCSFPPPTEAMKALSNKELKHQVAMLCAALDAFQKGADDQINLRLNPQQLRELDRKIVEDFKLRYLEQAMGLNNAIAARVGWVDIPDSKPNEANVVKADMWSTLAKHGRATLIFGSPRGPHPAIEVGTYLTFMAGNLSE